MLHLPSLGVPGHAGMTEMRSRQRRSTYSHVPEPALDLSRAAPGTRPRCARPAAGSSRMRRPGADGAHHDRSRAATGPARRSPARTEAPDVLAAARATRTPRRSARDQRLVVQPVRARRAPGRSSASSGPARADHVTRARPRRGRVRRSTASARRRRARSTVTRSVSGRTRLTDAVQDPGVARRHVPRCRAGPDRTGCGPISDRQLARGSRRPEARCAPSSSIRCAARTRAAPTQLRDRPHPGVDQHAGRAPAGPARSPVQRSDAAGQPRLAHLAVGPRAASSAGPARPVDRLRGVIRPSPLRGRAASLRLPAARALRRPSTRRPRRASARCRPAGSAGAAAAGSPAERGS